MTTTTVRSYSAPRGAPRVARAVFSLLKHLRRGTLDVQLPDGGLAHFGTPAAGAPAAAIRLLDWSACGDALARGDIGFAEAFIDGRWTTPDLAALLKLMLVNREAVESLVYGSRWGALLYRARHLLNRNSRRGSRRNIHAHYDLGNAFYALFLVETMTYSCAVFPEPASTLHEASVRKLDLVCRKLGLGPAHQVLEIGTGWGSFAIHAARHYGCRVTTTTISPAQRRMAIDRVRAAGLSDRIAILIKAFQCALSIIAPGSSKWFRSLP